MPRSLDGHLPARLLSGGTNAYRSVRMYENTWWRFLAPKRRWVSGVNGEALVRQDEQNLVSLAIRPVYLSQRSISFARTGNAEDNVRRRKAARLALGWLSCKSVEGLAHPSAVHLTAEATSGLGMGDGSVNGRAAAPPGPDSASDMASEATVYASALHVGQPPRVAGPRIRPKSARMLSEFTGLNAVKVRTRASGDQRATRQSRTNDAAVSNEQAPDGEGCRWWRGDTLTAVHVSPASNSFANMCLASLLSEGRTKAYPSTKERMKLSGGVSVTKVGSASVSVKKDCYDDVLNVWHAASSTRLCTPPPLYAPPPSSQHPRRTRALGTPPVPPARRPPTTPALGCFITGRTSAPLGPTFSKRSVHAIPRLRNFSVFVADWHSQPGQYARRLDLTFARRVPPWCCEKQL
ncbi:hypothetical protein GGX14DRAFT_400227 [Mycena pura]|uniref:Uncharacterized protein n=1 Tax=Mycena pura TaxID=153505 RepID=A0AAD6V294_9AGAR|nr:hypothetical protein GGX14DRAFT_400227 [Mycena pura]